MLFDKGPEEFSGKLTFLKKKRTIYFKKMQEDEPSWEEFLEQTVRAA